MKRILWLFLALSFASWADVFPITPVFQGSKTISVTTSSAATALPTTIAFQTANLELQNAGANTVFVEWGDSTATAAVATGYPVLAGQSKVITVPRTITHIAAITGTSTATLYVTVGSGN